MMERPPSRLLLMLPGVALILVGVLIVVVPGVLVWLAGVACVLFGIMLLVMASLIRKVGVALAGRGL